MRMFNITPKPRMLKGVQSQKWTASGAIAELIDNSFGAGRGNATAVSIAFDTAKRTLVILDNGQGMEYIGRLFQLGNTIGRTAGDIGHFGSGGTQAIIWLAEWVNVATERNDQIMQDSVKWEDIFDLEDFRDVSVSNEWQDGTLAIPERHGTVIRIKLLKERRLYPHLICRDLARLFAPGLRNGRQIIWTHLRDGEMVDEPVLLTDPFKRTTQPETTEQFRFVVRLGEKHLPVQGTIYFDKETSHADSWVRIGFSHREILKTRDCFKSEKTGESYAGIGVSGWLDLGDGWQEHFSTTKDAFNDQPLYEVLMEYVFEHIRELLKLAEDRTIDFELDNIALSLQMALNRTMQIKVKVKRGSAYVGNGTKKGGINEDGEPKREKIEEEENDASTHIRLIKQKDEQMLGVLARSGADPQGLYVDINKEHEFVREALRQKPINAAALNLMIVSEIAVLLSTDQKLAKDAFTSSFKEQLAERGEQEKVRFLVRHLMDNVPKKADLKAATGEAAE